MTSTNDIKDMVHGVIIRPRDMACGGYGGGDALNRTQKLKICSNDQPLDPMFASAPSKTFLEDEFLDEYFDQPEKKRRLSADQVQFLEKSFEAENRLEPERRIQLAKELGLQPRQIAIWFQNRRARWKTRQLETDYETLHASYNRLKTDYDNLLKESEKLKAEVLCLKNNGLARDTETTNLQSCEAKELSLATPKEVIADIISEDEEHKMSELVFKNEEQSSTKSDLTNVDSPRLTNRVHSFVLESSDSSHVFEELDKSDLSQIGEDVSNGELLQTDYIFPNLDDAHCHPPASYVYYGFPVEDHAFGFWSY
ncbi:hypothetical protein DH2020_038039 [Rehmannia glutinosa]|uniref:Homeobox-leucine zipper protein n=1 Tax=Rehmannia glutinosa TaxID=99300 RepID=A0ABR0V1R9_REHGL